jgi:hypothetical protein
MVYRAPCQEVSEVPVFRQRTGQESRRGSAEKGAKELATLGATELDDLSPGSGFIAHRIGPHTDHVTAKVAELADALA